MDTIDLKSKTSALPGQIESYWFENELIGLERTLFHKLSIPLQPFDSGIEYEEQPLSTSIEFDWYKLNIDNNPEKLDGLNLSNDNYPSAEASIYVGWAHVWCHVKKLVLELIKENEFRISGELLVEFEDERVGKNEIFTFETTAVYITTK